MSEWQTIESAPKDTRCLVWIDLRGKHVNDRSYAEICVWDDFLRAWRLDNYGPVRDTKLITHWMPVPPAPPHTSRIGE